MRGIARAAGARLYGRWRRAPLREGVLLEAFQGAGVSGDPAAIAAHLLATTDLSLTWALRRPVPFDSPRINAVKYRSPAYYKALATTRYLVNNVTFPPLFDKRDDQVYLNTWHGTPLKRMGRDSGAPWSQIANTVANFEAADILLSSGPYMTETMYVGAYGVDATAVAELGSPRVDEQFGVETDGVIVYAPTWQEESAADDLDDLVERMRAMPAGTLLRVHSKVAVRAAADPRLAGALAPERESTNALLGRAGLLITDFSSVAFDALATGVSVVFFTPTSYPRGVYLNDDELPGPRTSSLDELTGWLSAGLPSSPVPLEVARTRFCPSEDGGATARVTARLLAR